MNRCALVIVLILCLFATNVGYGQSSPVFALKDSVKIDLNQTALAVEKLRLSKLIKQETKLFVLTSENRKLYVIDLLKVNPDTIHAISDARGVNKPVLNFELSYNSVFVADSRIDFLREYDFSGNQIGRIRLNRQLSKRFVSGRENLAYCSKRNSIFLNVDESSPERQLDTKPELAAKYFQRSDLIVEIDRSGKKVNYFGTFDSLYRQNFYFYGINYSFSMNESGVLVLSQELSADVKVYAPPYTNVKTLSFKGKFISKEESELPITKHPYLTNEAYYHDVISAFQYQNVNFLNNRNLCYRTYVDATSDTTLLRTYPLITHSSTTGKCKAPSLRMLDQLEILKSKKLFVQIFDIETGFVLYDGPFVFKGKFFLPAKEASSEEFFTYDWKDGVFTLYRYKLEQK
jgi:hypothetical protein